ncbi:MAG: helix-turn-helix domain-containing protein [Hungatella hathewayi]|uniref:helix-turn-helix domain-containing protein n=1 Tax=Hungatella hathewayi TaxID=154046 RepID=UPI003993CE54
MVNNKILMYMKLKDINKTQLSALTGIPATTLNRIINGTVINVKTAYMENIAKALGTTIYNLFDLPELNQPLITALRPEEAGTVVEKLLSEEESLLLYWFQNSSQDSRASILMKARNEYYVTQREINEKLSIGKAFVSDLADYNQIEFNFKHPN